MQYSYRIIQRPKFHTVQYLTHHTLFGAPQSHSANVPPPSRLCSWHTLPSVNQSKSIWANFLSTEHTSSSSSRPVSCTSLNGWAARVLTFQFGTRTHFGASFLPPPVKKTMFGCHSAAVVWLGSDRFTTCVYCTRSGTLSHCLCGKAFLSGWLVCAPHRDWISNPRLSCSNCAHSWVASSATGKWTLNPFPFVLFIVSSNKSLLGLVKWMDGWMDGWLTLLCLPCNSFKESFYFSAARERPSFVVDRQTDQFLTSEHSCFFAVAQASGIFRIL